MEILISFELFYWNGTRKIVLLIESDLLFYEMQVSIVSVVYSQSELLQKEVFLVELVESITMSREPMSHLKAVYFLRPTSENIQHLRRQLANPRFGEYHLCKICFNNLIGNYESG